MCGICGILNKNGKPVDEMLLFAMTDTMVQRGPDDDGYFVDGAIGLGFRRLAIVDVVKGHQPLTNEDGTVWAVFNGEIYNYKELRQGLSQRGHRLRSESDSEVIVHLYEEMGIDFLNDLRGMFALAIYDVRRQSLYLARDHFGIKPLFYSDKGFQFVFGSDIKSILATGIMAPQVDKQSLWNYLTFQYVPDPNTMFTDILKVPAGHYLKVCQESVSLHEYWKAEFRPDESKPLSYFVEGIRDKLQTSVNLHLTGDVPRGALLSGGIDSSTIAALMSQSEPIRTFSVGFENNGQLGLSGGFVDELKLAAETAGYLGTNHHSLRVSAKQYQEQLPRLIYNQEDPVADPSAIALHFVAELSSTYVTVILSGEGADEMFGGYPIYHEPVSLGGFRYLPGAVRTAAGRLAQHLPVGMKGRSFLERGATPLNRRFIGNAKVFTDDMKHLLLDSDFMSADIRPSFAVTDPHYLRTESLDDITRMQDIDMHTWLPGDILAKADKMTMANSLELRVPFLDREVFDFAATIPTKYRVHRGQTKLALRQAVDPWLPKAVSSRPKRGFPVPFRQWLRVELLNFAWTVLSSPSARIYFDAWYINNLLREHSQGVRDNAHELWVLITFVLWHEIFIARRQSFAPMVSPRVEVRRRRMQAVQ